MVDRLERIRAFEYHFGDADVVVATEHWLMMDANLSGTIDFPISTLTTLFQALISFYQLRIEVNFGCLSLPVTPAQVII